MCKRKQLFIKLFSRMDSASITHHNVLPTAPVTVMFLMVMRRHLSKLWPPLDPSLWLLMLLAHRSSCTAVV